MKKLVFIILSFISIAFLTGCLFQSSDKGSDFKLVEDKKWTFLVYMAADNNLEKEALNDIKEMEQSGFDTEKINLLVLVDRAVGYDSSDGDWTDTRLYKIRPDKSGKKNIVSQRLGCEELGIPVDSSVELDMAHRSTISGFIAFGLENYPAEKTCFILWGHGSGWRYYSTDNYSDSVLSLFELGEGIRKGIEKSESKIDVIGFDTCFGMNLETLYELKDCADFIAGTPGLEDGSGWNYSFAGDFSKTDFSTEELFNCLSVQFLNQNRSNERACFSVAETSVISELTEAFKTYSVEMADSVKSGYDQRNVRYLIQNDVTGYEGSSYPCDHYADLYELNEKTKDLVTLETYSSLKEKLQSLIFMSVRISEDLSSEVPLGIFYNTYVADKVCSAVHPSGYIYGSSQTGKCSFVIQCSEYVPTTSQNNSFLDCLFYKTFN